MEVEADDNGLLTGREGARREENWGPMPEWQQRSEGRKNGREAAEGEEEMPKDEVVTLV